MILIIGGIQRNQTYEDRKQSGGYQGEEKMGDWVDGYRVSDVQDEKILEICFTTT